MQTAMTSFPTLSSGGSLDSYVHAISANPVLSEEEERNLARQFLQQGDLNAAKQLVLSHLRFVVYIAKGYAGYGLPMSDLIQEGNVGLMKAVRRFDPEVGVRLVSFAVHWIKSEIYEFVIRNWRIVKVATTKAQRKLFYNLRSAKKRLGGLRKEEVDQIATDLGVPNKTVLEMEKRMAAQDASFDSTVQDEENDTLVPARYLEAENSDPEQLALETESEKVNQRALKKAMSQLDDRSREIVELRWLAEKKVTLHQLADKYKISAERVRQLEQAALKQMRGALAFT